MSFSASNNKIVQLNVGGTRYDVSRDTLERYQGSMLANLISSHWREGNSNEPIFIDRNGLLFQYVLDFLRNNKFYLPFSVSRASVNAEFEYYGIAEGICCNNMYENSYFFAKADEILAKSNQLAAINAAVQSAQITEKEHLPKQEMAFFIMIEYYKNNPLPGQLVSITLPQKYHYSCHGPWVLEDLKKRGFEVPSLPQYPDHIMTIKRET